VDCWEAARRITPVMPAPPSGLPGIGAGVSKDAMELVTRDVQNKIAKRCQEGEHDPFFKCAQKAEGEAAVKACPGYRAALNLPE
jgi:hypothetical protein